MTQYAHWNHTSTQNLKHSFQQNLFIPGCKCTTRQWAIQRKSSRFALNPSRLMPKVELYYIEKMQSYKGNPSNHVIFRGVSPKILFLLWSLMIACFQEHLARELWKLVHWVKKIMQIPNMTVNLLSEQFLTMNLFKWRMWLLSSLGQALCVFLVGWMGEREPGTL